MPVPHCMFSAGRCVFWSPLAGAESDFCGRHGRWKGLIFRHNRVFVQNQGAVLKKSSLRGVHPDDFPSRQGENERRPISCAHSSWIKRSTLLCRKMTRVYPVVSFPLFFYLAACSGKYSLFSGSCNRRFGGGGYRKNTRKEYIMIVRYGFSRFTRVFFLRTKDETATNISKYLAEIAPRKVEVVRSDGAASFRKVLLMPLYNRENQARIYDNRFPTIQRRC